MTKPILFLAVLPLGVLACSSATPAPETPAAASAPAEAAPAPAAGAAALPAPVGAATCENLVIEDLEDGDGKSAAVDGRGGYWFTYKDSAGSTVAPEGTFTPASGGAGSSKSAARMSGKTGAAGTVYVGMGFNLADPMGPYDLSKAKSFCFSAKGKGSVRVKLPDVNTIPEGGVCKSCYNDFGADFALTDDWKEHCFEFSALKQQSGWGEPKPAPALDHVYSMQWQVSAPGADYEVWVDEIKLKCN
jgi:hypothetical protein